MEENFKEFRDCILAVPCIRTSPKAGVLLSGEEARKFLQKAREKSARENSVEVPDDTSIEEDLQNLTESLSMTVVKRRYMTMRDRSKEGRVEALCNCLRNLPYRAEARLF